MLRHGAVQQRHGKGMPKMCWKIHAEDESVLETEAVTTVLGPLDASL
jgi:hypothetical protein